MGIAEHIVGAPALTAVLVIATGIFGAIVARPLLNAIGVMDWRGFRRHRRRSERHRHGSYRATAGQVVT